MKSDGSATRVTLGAMQFPPDYAGPGLRFQRYHPLLANRRIDMDVCAIGLRPDARSEVELAGIPVVDEFVGDIPVRRLQIEASNAVRSIHFRYARSLASHVARAHPAVVHLLQLSPWGLPGLMSIRRLGSPIVYTETMMPEGGITRPVRGAHWRYPFTQLDRVVVSSSVMAEAMRACGIRAAIDVIPNGVDLRRFSPVDPTVRQAIRCRLGLPPAAPVILFVGGYLSRRKGLDVLANAWPLIEHQYPDAELVLVGPEDVSSYRAPAPQRAFIDGIRERLASATAAGRVRFTGSVTNVEEYFQAADVFVFPSRKEGMPNVLPEACACGTAIVLTAFKGLSPEMGRPGETFELVDRHPRAIADSVSRLLGDPTRRVALGEAARRWVEHNMDVERSVQAYADLYRSLAGRSS